MTPEQIALVQTSFTAVNARGSEFAHRFFELYFEAAPSYRSLFSRDQAVQGELLLTELAVIVRSISDFDRFVARTRELGARHERFGVTYEHYDAAGRILLRVLAETFGPAFTDELRDAWRLAFDLMAETMMQGGADARGPS